MKKVLIAILLGGGVWGAWDSGIIPTFQNSQEERDTAAQIFDEESSKYSESLKLHESGAVDDFSEYPVADAWSADLTAQDFGGESLDLDVVSLADADLTKMTEDSESVTAWRQFANELGLECNELGICINNDRGEYKIFSAHEVIVKAPVGARNWVESRQLAAAKAELRAKANIVQFEWTKIEGGRSSSDGEDLVVAVGDSKEIILEDRSRLDEIRDRAEVLALIGADYAESELNKRLKADDPFYNSEKYKELPPKERLVQARGRNLNKLRESAEELLRGAVPIFSHESVDTKSGKSRVLVAVLWTPTTRHVVASIGRGDYNAKVSNPDGKTGTPAESQIPEDKNSLLGAFGVRMYLDEKGEHYFLSFAQSGARRSQSHQEQAIKIAEDIAGFRARGNLAYAISDYIELDRGLDGSEDDVEFTDQSVYRDTRREYNLRVKSRTGKTTLRGVSTVKKWAARHPVSDQIVVGSVVKWSPTGEHQAATIRRLINQTNQTGEAPKNADTGKAKKYEDFQSTPLRIDLDAY